MGSKKPAKLEPGSRVSPWFLLYVGEILVLILSVMDCYLRVNRVNRTDPSLTRLLLVGVFP